jgi:hypothetical protein
VTPARTVLRGGRKRDLGITKAIEILSDEMRGHKELEPRERWERIFETRCCPECIEGWSNMDQDQRATARKNLRQALRTRAGVGIPPPIWPETRLVR